MSIIILNFNTFDLTVACIKSIYAKTGFTDFEIVLVDNGSTEKDPTLFLDIFPHLKLVCSSENLGFAKGNNLGIQHASGNIILLLNSDTTLKNDALTTSYFFLVNHNSCGAVGARLEYPNGELQHNCQRFPSIKYKLFELLRLQKFLPKETGGRILLGSFFDHNQALYPDWIWGTFFMFKREVLGFFEDEKLPGDFFMYVEDMQWCLEIRRIGYQIAFEPAGIVIHHMGKSLAKKTALMEQNLDTFMQRYYSGLQRFIIKWLDRRLSS